MGFGGNLEVASGAEEEGRGRVEASGLVGSGRVANRVTNTTIVPKPSAVWHFC